MDISIVEDHKLVAQFLKTSLLQLNFIESVRVYNSATDFLRNLELLKTDLLILDVYLPDINGLDLVSELRKTKTKSALRIAMFSSTIDQNLINKAFEYGANGFFPKNISLDELSQIIRLIFSNPYETYLGNGLMNAVSMEREGHKITVHLSPIEKRVLKLLEASKTIDDIAFKMDLSFETIQFYVNKIMRKFDVKRIDQLQSRIIEQGFIFNE